MIETGGAQPLRLTFYFCIRDSDRIFHLIQAGTYHRLDPTPHRESCQLIASGRHLASSRFMAAWMRNDAIPARELTGLPWIFTRSHCPWPRAHHSCCRCMPNRNYHGGHIGENQRTPCRDTTRASLFPPHLMAAGILPVADITDGYPVTPAEEVSVWTPLLFIRGRRGFHDGEQEECDNRCGDQAHS